MKIPVLLSLAVLALSAFVPSATAHQCKVVCDAAHSAPVCGSNGKTYTSKCFLEFAKCASPKLTTAHDGACAGKKEKNVIHVSIGKSNEDANAKTTKKSSVKVNVTTAQNKKCEKPCTRELDQLCASDGKTYNNHCLYEIALCYDASLTIKNPDGPCRSEEDEDESEDEVVELEEEKKDKKCEKTCTRELEQLCASDGKTYNNHCLYEIALCNDASLTVKNPDGPCPTEKDESAEGEDESDDAEVVVEEEKKDKCQKGCSRELDMLCASDGKTYNNHCLFEIALCRNSSLAIVDADGPCPKK